MTNQFGISSCCLGAMATTCVLLHLRFQGKAQSHPYSTALDEERPEKSLRHEAVCVLAWLRRTSPKFSLCSRLEPYTSYRSPRGWPVRDGLFFSSQGQPHVCQLSEVPHVSSKTATRERFSYAGELMGQTIACADTITAWICCHIGSC